MNLGPTRGRRAGADGDRSGQETADRDTAGVREADDTSRAAANDPSGVPAAGADTAESISLGAAIVRTARPRQWLKNVLVLTAPGAAGVLTHGHALGRTAIGFGVFCLAASGTYFVNDARDAEADRHHPEKRNRPVAAGALSVRLAGAIGVAGMAAAVALATLSRPQLGAVIAIYLGVQIAYTGWLKHEPILDIAAVAAGFVLRAIAGGVAAGVPLSNWFLIVASSGSLLMVSGKRYAESMTLGENRGNHRPTLATYSLQFLRYVRSVSSSVAITAYFLWAFEKAGAVTPGLPAVPTHSGHGAIWFELSVVPFALAILRYAFLLDTGQGGAPEEVVLGDRMLQLLGLVLVGVFAVGLYLA